MYKRQDSLIASIKELAFSISGQILEQSNIELTQEEAQTLKQNITEYLDKQSPAAIQTIINSYNYIFQSYNFPYVLNETYTEEIETYAIDQMQHGDKTSRATLVVNSATKNNLLKIDYEYIYDKKEAYEQYVVADGEEDNIPFEEFDISEGVTTIFNKSTTWITKSKSTSVVKMSDIQVFSTSYLIFQ